jgi:hypothetical protein
MGQEILNQDNPTIRDFKGIWIPRKIWLDKRLTSLEKLLYAEIDSFCKGNKGCFASNKYFADFFDVGKQSISNSISKLVKLKYIKTAPFDGRVRRITIKRL